MNYRNDKYGNPLSILGFGCMRFTTRMGKIDVDKAESEIMTAIGEGVNYFDTAFIYPGSEALLGEILERNNVRNKVNIATKLPHYLIKSKEVLEKLFNEQLRRLRTDHIDYYLMHMLTDVDEWGRLCDMGILDWIAQKKADGAIRQIGFSYHGNSDTFKNLIDVYNWDFCMIQYNYMDEHTQAGKRGLDYAHSKGLPVIIMEPLRGGRLVSNLPEKAQQIIAAHKPARTPVQWALRWLWNQPEVTVVLSGMNSVDMIRDNIENASDASVGEFSRDDIDMLADVAASINAKIKVGCTGCGYCMPCPKNVDIPGTFSAYNRRYVDGRYRSLKDYVMCTTLRKNSTAASNCIGCGKCESHCPQGIEIRKELKAAKKELEGPLYKIFSKAAKLFVKF